MAASDEESTVHDMNAAVTSTYGEDWYDLPNETLKDINGSCLTVIGQFVQPPNSFGELTAILMQESRPWMSSYK